MHCPRCGQEQASENLKFCSRCGLPLALVAEIVTNGGVLPQLRDLRGGIFTRNNGLKVSLLWFLVIDFLLVPLAAVAGGEEEVAFLAIVGFVGAAIMAVLSVLFLRNPGKQMETAQVNAAQGLPSAVDSAGAAALPAGQMESAADYVSPAGSWKAADTGDLARPASVTEPTTKLLKKEEEGS